MHAPNVALEGLVCTLSPIYTTDEKKTSTEALPGLRGFHKVERFMKAREKNYPPAPSSDCCASWKGREEILWGNSRRMTFTVTPPKKKIKRLCD